MVMMLINESRQFNEEEEADLKATVCLHVEKKVSDL